MRTVIPDAIMPTDSLKVECVEWTATPVVLLTAECGLEGRQTVIMLDVEGAEKLAQFLIPFLCAGAEAA